MSWILDFYRSAMAKKAVMAVTGILLFGFVFGHMVGNLKLYYGPGTSTEKAQIDEYAVGLREIGSPILGPEQALWIARIGLLAAVLLHIHAATSLTLLNRRARPVNYAKRSAQKATYASRTMRWGGVIILLFIVYHLMHLTFGNVHPEFEHGSVYKNVVLGFQESSGVGLLYRCPDRPRLPPLPRSLESAAIPRAQRPAAQHRPPAIRGGLCRHRLGGQHLFSRRRPDRSGDPRRLEHGV